jgi:hypothetical protein
MRVLTTCFLLFLFGCSEKKTDGVNSNSAKEIDKSWIGTWEKQGFFTGADLTISSADSGFSFSMEAYNGGNSGAFEAVLFPLNNKVSFSDEEEECTLSFTLFGDTLIKIEQNESSCGAGNGVSFGGNYYKKGYKKPTPETLLSLGVFTSQKQEDAFIKLAGEYYKQFLSSSQIVSKEENLDPFKAEVNASGVRGLFTSMENIIMIDDSLRIWAAVIDEDKVHYFTNDSLHTHTLPLTIEHWREDFKQLEVVYEK